MPTFLTFRRAGLARPKRLLLCLTLLLPLTAMASVGKVVIAQGEVYALDPNNEQRSLARRSDVNEGDTLVTGADGSLQIRFNDNAVLALSPDSQLRISEYHGRDADNDEEQVLMDLLAGGFRTITGSIGSTDRDAYQVRTPNASIGIRGTHYEALLAESSLLLGVYDGGIVVSNENGSLNLGLGGNFLFAQVGPNTAPQGLLEPPARLNQSRVPGTGQSGQPSPDDEPEAQLEEEEEGLPLEMAFGGDEPPPPIPQLTEEQESALLTLVSDLEDEVDDLGEDAANLDLPADVRLTTEQQLALANNPAKGFIVLTDSGDGDAVHFVYRVEGTNGPVFINYDSELLNELDNGYVSPDRVYLGPTLTAPQSLVTLEREDQTVEWGIWNASTTDPATLLESSTSLSESSLDTTPFFYVFAEPADLTSLTGTRNFSLCEDMSCIDIIASNGATLSDASGSLNVDLDASTITAYGSLNLTMSNSASWDIYYNALVEGSILSASSNANQLSDSTYYDGLQSTTGVTGEIQGLFINGADQNLDFVGGFGVSSNEANESISGVFLMTGSGGEEDITPQ